ncbi:Right handed beta helix region [uncultured archaeon]|nr:Right handed beta helix region [uncultured archaeon]
MKKNVKKSVITYRRSSSRQILITFVIILLIVIGFIIVNFFSLTGKVIFSSESESYHIGESLNGSVSVEIFPEDLIQKDSLINIQIMKDNSELASKEISFEEFLFGQLMPVQIFNKTSICENITVENIIQNCTEQINENNETIFCENITTRDIIQNCSTATSDFYFKQPGIYSRNVSDFISYTFSDFGVYKLIVSDSLGVSNEKDIIVYANKNDSDKFETETFSIMSFSGVGDGSLLAPYIITNCTQLQEMQNDLNSSYILGNDIDCSDTVNWNSGTGFIPVGRGSSLTTCIGEAFSGNLNGNNHKISNIFINSNGSCLGLFGYLTGNVNNLGIVNITIFGNSSTKLMAGGIAGSSGSNNITDSYVIYNIYTIARGGSAFIGGIVGNGGNIDNCYSVGNLTAGTYVPIFSSYIGGITGLGGTINHSYSVSNISLAFNASVVAGGLGGISGKFSKVSNSFAIVNLSVNGSEGGGLVGFLGSGTITNSYWNNVSGSLLDCYIGGNGNCTAIQDNENYFKGDVYPMNAPMSGWDFFNTWQEVDSDYPHLSWEGLGGTNLVSSCQEINRPGVYTMNRNFNESDVNLTGCFNITVSNVILDCAGFYIRNYSINSSGIYAGSENGISNITIKNCNISIRRVFPNGNGILFSNVNNSFLINNILTNSSYYGIFLYSSSNNQIINNTANSNYNIGIYINLSSNNTLIRNTVNSNAGEGIFLYSSSNNQIINNTANLNFWSGIDVYSSSNNQIINNTANSNIGIISSGIRISNSSNNTVKYNTANSNFGIPQQVGVAIGIYISDSDNNIIAENTLNRNYGPRIGGIGLELDNSLNNIIANNTLDSNRGVYANGFYLYSSSNNTFLNNTILNCTSNLGCIDYSSDSNSNVFIGGIINFSTGNLIYFTANSSNNLFKDVTLIGATTNNTYLDEGSINNTFLNVTYSSSNEYVETGSELILKWYLDINVTNLTSDLLNVNVSVYNVSNSLQFSELTNASGKISRRELIEYVNNGNLSYYSNYTANATKTAYYSNSTTINLSGNTNIKIILNAVFNNSTVNPVNTPAVDTNTGNSGGGGGGGSSVVLNSTNVFWKNTIDTTTDLKTDLAIGYSKDLGVQERVKINIDSGESHYVGTVSVNSDEDSAVISIMSTPQNVTFKVGEEKKFELDNDEYYDLYVKLNNIVNKKANVTVKNIHEKITGDATLEPKVPEKKEEEPKTSNEESPLPSFNINPAVFLFIGFITLISVLIIVYFMIIINRKNAIIKARDEYYSKV